jgi:hypothetical protein
MFWSSLLQYEYDTMATVAQTATTLDFLEWGGGGAGVKACTEMLITATFATPELLLMCYIAGCGSFLQLFRRDSCGSRSNHDQNMFILCLICDLPLRCHALASSYLHSMCATLLLRAATWSWRLMIVARAYCLMVPSV